MAQTPSNMVQLGTIAKGFILQDAVTGKLVSLKELTSPIATVIAFICNHCPFVKHINKELVKLGNEYLPRQISFVAISSNDVTNYPQDDINKMKEVALDLQYPFPYLFDETQEVAKAYNAACTPDFYIYDKELKLVYRGQLDDSRPSNGIPVSGKDIREALENIISGKSVNPDQRPSIGCNIKWKK